VSAANSPPVSYVPREWLYQAQAGYRTRDDRWSATLSCKNCSDERYMTSWFIGPYFGDPRTWELRVGYRFE
jgi:outer membrane receptor protein involved in Fe transport